MRVKYHLTCGAAILRSDAAPIAFTSRKTLRRLISAGELSSLVEDAERARRGGHQEAIAAGDQAFDVVRIGVRMAAGHIVLFADCQDALDFLGHHRMVIVAR